MEKSDSQDRQKFLFSSACCSYLEPLSLLFNRYQEGWGKDDAISPSHAKVQNV
jgi:hypothetical protein